MAQKKQNEVEFVTQFINTYKAHPALWKIKSKKYGDRVKKENGYQALIEVYRTCGVEDADKDIVKRKIQSLRASFRREFKRVKTVKLEMGEESERPSLWFFDLLLFTVGQEDATETVANEDNNFENGQTAETNRLLDHSRKSTRILKRKPNDGVKIKLINRDEMLKKPYEGPSSNYEDEYEAYAVSVAAKLRKLPKDQRLYCENIINTALYRAALDQLCETSTVTLEEHKATQL